MDLHVYLYDEKARLAYRRFHKLTEPVTYLVIAAIVKPSGSCVGRSFNECTTKSISFLSSAISNSLVNKLFSPILDSATSKILSPVVLMPTLDLYNKNTCHK